AVVFNVEAKFGKRCLWADINQEKLTLRDMGHTASEEGQGFCHGARFGELIAMTKGPEALTALEHEIGQIFKGEGNPVIKRLTDRFYKITFDQSFYGQES